MRTRLPLLLSAFIAFVGSLGGSFHLDDYSLLFNPDIASVSGLPNLWLPLATRPLTNATFWLNYQAGGDYPLSYHLVNLALHLSAVWLLFGVLSRLISARAALIATAIFAIHPIQAEAVNYVFERATILATIGCLLALRDWLDGRPWRSVLWFAAALLAKEECVAFPVFLVLLHRSGKRQAREWPPIAVMFTLSLAAGIRVLIAAAANPGSHAGIHAGISRADYALTQGAVILRYFRLMVIPWGFTIDPGLDVIQNWTGWLAWIVLLALCIFSATRFSDLRAGFWFLGGLVLLLPSSSIFPANDLAADRRMYLPLVAFCACLGLLLERVDWRVLSIAGALLIALSVQRTLVWRSERSLWEDAVAKAPDKVRPKVQLARALSPSAALPVLEAAQQLAPEDPDVATDQGKVYLELGQPAQALAAFGRALALHPNDPAALNNRGVALLALSQKEAAEQDFRRALSLNPCQYDARLNLWHVGIREPIPSACRFTPAQTTQLEGR